MLQTVVAQLKSRMCRQLIRTESFNNVATSSQACLSFPTTKGLCKHWSSHQQLSPSVSRGVVQESLALQSALLLCDKVKSSLRGPNQIPCAVQVALAVGERSKRVYQDIPLRCRITAHSAQQKTAVLSGQSLTPTRHTSVQPSKAASSTCPCIRERLSCATALPAVSAYARPSTSQSMHVWTAISESTCSTSCSGAGRETKSTKSIPR